LICGIGGYPASECGVEIDMPAAQAMTTSAQNESVEEDNTSEIQEGFEPVEYLAIGAALLAALGIFVLIRRRK
jgi:LPXTG-motif cell wall-anchored protein